MHSEWELTNLMCERLFMMMFPIAWKIITRKLAVQEGMVKNHMRFVIQ